MTVPNQCHPCNTEQTIMLTIIHSSFLICQTIVKEKSITCSRTFAVSNGNVTTSAIHAARPAPKKFTTRDVFGTTVSFLGLIVCVTGVIGMCVVTGAAFTFGTNVIPARILFLGLDVACSLSGVI